MSHTLIRVDLMPVRLQIDRHALILWTMSPNACLVFYTCILMCTCSVLLWGGVCSPLPCDYNATTRDRTQVFFCVNITIVYLLTSSCVLWYSRVRVCIKGCLNLSLDILCCLWLRCSQRVQHRSTHLSTCKYSQCLNAWQPVSSVVNPWASCLPQSAPRVNVNSTNVYPCARVCLVVTWGGPWVWHRGRVLTCVNYSCSHLSTPEGKFE